MPEFPIIPEDKMRQMLEPPTGRIRLLIDTDAHNEIDDQYTIAWALLSQDRFDIEGVVAEPYSFKHEREPTIKAYDALKQDANAVLSDTANKYRRTALNMIASEIDPHEIVYVNAAEGMELSYQEILKVYELLEEDPAGKVFRGSDRYLTSFDEPIDSPAARHIIERAMADDDRPLHVACIGCVTNLASAILMKPEIITRIVVSWTSSYPSHMKLHLPSFNLVQDILSSQLLFDCGVPHVYLPGYYIGAQLSLSLPEMEEWVRGKSKMGDYLYHLYTHNPDNLRKGIVDHFGRTRVIWDLINFAWLLNPDWVPSHLVNSPILTDELYWEHDDSRHLMREAVDINRDAIFRDLFTKLEKAP
jgi:inosine-uridine nucleoside N-ribohydrolase